MSTSLSVGQISTLIAAAVFVSGLLLRNVFPLIIVRSIKRENNAVTWSLIQRLLGSADWPFILQTDSTSYKTIDRRIRALNSVFLFSTILLGIAAVASPAGLYESVDLRSQPTDTSFESARDESPFGQIARQKNPWPWRQCVSSEVGELSHRVNCPGSDQLSWITENSTGRYMHWEGGAQFVDVDISRPEIFQSGLVDQEPTVSSFFDIQARRYNRITADEYGDFDGNVVVDGFHVLDGSTVQQDRYLAIEGLVVDAKVGGIGFRNHTVPSNVPLGAEWEEDLLFLEPETSCVDMGLVVEFTVPIINTTMLTVDSDSWALIDEGGFADFDPILRPSSPPHGQQDLDLQHRAEVWKWWAIRYLMGRVNLTDQDTGEPIAGASQIGNYFNTTESSQGITGAQGISTMLSSETLGYDFYTSSMGTNFSTYEEPIYLNATDCSGWEGGDLISISNFPITCGFLVGAAIQSDGTMQIVAEDGMTLRRKIYSCSSATKASIKTVHFNYNSTGSNDQTSLFSGLSVISINSKNYSDGTEPPLWGLETPPMRSYDMDPIWGLISEENSQLPDLTRIRATSFYPPHRPNEEMLSNAWRGSSYLPGSVGLGPVMSSSYSILADPLSTFYEQSAYANGNTNLALFRRWQALSRESDSAGTLINLVWTQFASNYFMGIRGWLTNGDVVPTTFREDTIPSFSNTVPTFQFQLQIRYNWVYATPALLFCAIFLVSLLAGIFSAARGGLKDIRQYLSMLSAGRILLDNQAGNEMEYQISYKRWAKKAGLGLTIFRTTGWRWQRIRDVGEGEDNFQYPKTWVDSDVGSPGVMTPSIQPTGHHNSLQEHSEIALRVAELRQDAKRPFLGDNLSAN